jgi:small subunit ribosomal protein S7
MRKKRVYKKHYGPDTRHNRIDMGRFINYLMKDGKKTTAERVFYSTLDQVAKETKEDGVAVFEKALANASPQIQVVSRRVGGANYQVPHEVNPERRFVLACRWILAAARAKKGMPMYKRLSSEIVAASKNEGAAIKKKLDTHKQAEANRAFAHFA